MHHEECLDRGVKHISEANAQPQWARGAAKRFKGAFPKSSGIPPCVRPDITQGSGKVSQQEQRPVDTSRPERWGDPSSSPVESASLNQELPLIQTVPAVVFELFAGLMPLSLSLEVAGFDPAATAFSETGADARVIIGEHWGNAFDLGPVETISQDRLQTVIDKAPPDSEVLLGVGRRVRMFHASTRAVREPTESGRVFTLNFVG